MKILANASSCSSRIFVGTMKTAFPLPSWIAFGQSNTAAQVRPERSTSPHFPSLITLPTNALQRPSFELGNPEKLQVQPGAQLQNS